MAFLAGGFQCPAGVDPLVGSHHRCRPASRLVSSARVGGPAQRLRVLIGKINSFFFDSKIKSFLFVVKLTCYTKHLSETNVLSKNKSRRSEEEEERSLRSREGSLCLWMLAWIRSALCAQQGWPCLLLSAFLSSVTALFLQQSIKSCRSTEWTVLLTSPAYLAALVSNFIFSTFLSNFCQATENCFPPLSLAQVSPLGWAPTDARTNS